MHGTAVAESLDSIQSVIATILDMYTAIIYCIIILWVMYNFIIDVVALDSIQRVIATILDTYMAISHVGGRHVPTAGAK